jgi:KaiC/GvpD/RAD55 family RecA-like ATPase
MITAAEETSPLKVRRRPKPLVMVPTGLSNLDMRLGGGLGKKKLGIVCAQTGLGKTALAVQFAWGAARLGWRAKIASLEIPEDEMMQRLYANVLRFPYELLLKGDRTGALSEEDINARIERGLADLPEDVKDRLDLWDMSASGEARDVHSLRRRIRAGRDRGKDTDVLLVDWLDIMDITESQRKNMPIKELRHKLQKNSEELTQLAIDENIAIWTYTQANAQADGRDRVRLTNASEAYSKAWRCSVFLGMGASDANREDNIFTITCGKARDGRLFTIRLRAFLDQMRFEDLEESLSTPDLPRGMSGDFSSPEARAAERQGEAPARQAAPAMMPEWMRQQAEAISGTT